jgi:hypothetical protein
MIFRSRLSFNPAGLSVWRIGICGGKNAKNRLAEFAVSRY